MKVIEKLKGVMTPEDLTALEDAMKAAVNEEVEAKVALLIAEEQKKMTAASEKLIAEKVEEQKKALIAEYDEKLGKLEETLVEQLDAFLTSEVQSNISDAAVTKVAVNECLVPIVDGIRKVFTENYVELGSEGEKKIRELSEKVEELSTQASQLIAEKMELASKIGKRDVADLIAQKTQGLKADQVTRVKAMFENESVEVVAGKIDGFVALIVEAENKAPAKPKNKVEDGAATPAPQPQPINEKVDPELAAAASFME